VLKERDRLKTYREKRDFSRTQEPAGGAYKTGKKLRYLIQKHAARREHYDFRLEWGGTLMSWAVPKGPSENPDDKRLAVHVEDHPVEYGKFEGTIPKGEYGGGTVMLWDRGFWNPNQDVDEGLAKGKLSFRIDGERLRGNWALVRLRKRSAKDKDNWLLIKEIDEHVRKTGKPVTERETKSVTTGRTMAEIAAGKRGKKVWHSDKKKAAEEKSEKPRLTGRAPAFLSPQLATLVDAPPAGKEWLHEIKYDGYRAIASLGSGQVVIRTRNGLNWTDKFASLVPVLEKLPCKSALLDGEIAVAGKDGHTDFGALQDALSQGKGGFGYYLFDLLELDGKDLKKRPLTERKAALKKLLKGAKWPLFYSDHIAGDGDRAFAHACELKLEGIISKSVSAPYRSGRTKSWLKSKCGMEQEFVIIGWRPSGKAGRQFSSLLLALRENNKLRYAGRVGSGYSDTSLDNLSALFKKHARKGSPVPDVPPAIARQAKFLDPVLVAEIAFRGWTRDNLVRQGSFKGLRGDKPASQIIRERPMPKTEAVTVKSSKDAEEIGGVRVTHPDRVLFPSRGVTKRELIEHYRKVAKLMLPHVEGRPLALVRCPKGSEKQCFYQKHASEGWPEEFHRIRIREKSGNDEYMYIEDERGLIAAAQMSVLELHLWGSHVDTLEKPDRMVFDLDPDEGLPFSKVKEAAKELKERLKDAGLQSFPMATGGKGIHVVVPLAPKHSWDDHRNFAEAIVRLMAEDSPERYVANMSKAKRRGKIFIDYLRNQRGSTAIAPYSSRARAGAHYALPVSWQGLAKLKDARPAKIGQTKPGADPWKGYFKLRQALPLGKKRG
jgi:bifunctional non-homologous end joining protein LigD